MSNYDYTPLPGDHIDSVAEYLCKLARALKREVTAPFNDITLRANPNSASEDVVKQFHVECNRRHDAYLASPEYRKAQEEMAQKESDRARACADILIRAPKTMTLRDASFWEQMVRANPDSYGAAVLRYAELWARLMEARISEGVALEYCAESLSHLADEEGITGAMYGMAVAVLSKAWIHGEPLRKWHNKEYGNPESKGVINPAILTVGG